VTAFCEPCWTFADTAEDGKITRRNSMSTKQPDKLAYLALSVLLAACGGDDIGGATVSVAGGAGRASAGAAGRTSLGGARTNTGGSRPSTGGAAAGAMSARGGSAESGTPSVAGADSGGGTANVGGANSSGGSVNAGGLEAAAGRSVAGTAANAGGTTSTTGGGATTGGLTSSGGQTSTGGSNATAGTPSAGGTPNAAGQAGAPATGGADNLAGAENGGAGGSCATFYYLDSDDDGWGGDTVACNPGATGTWVTQTGDCEDQNADVHPNQQNYFATAYTPSSGGEPSFDYNCDGEEEMQGAERTSTGTCAPAAVGNACEGTGYLPADPARVGADLNLYCGSTRYLTCVRPQNVCTGAESTVDAAVCR
jgi:hypothetical protein